MILISLQKYLAVSFNTYFSLQLIKDDLWPNPLQYYLVPDIEVEPEDNE